MQNRAGVEAGAIVKRIEKEAGGRMRYVNDPTNRSDQHENDDDTERSSHAGVDACGGLDAVAVQNREQQGKEDCPRNVGNLGAKFMAARLHQMTQMSGLMT